MMTALLAATLSIAPAPVYSAADFFPLKAGSRRTYEEKSIQTSVTTDVVETPVEIKGVMTIPVTTLQNGTKVNTAYYRVDADGVAIVAYDPTNPLPKPLPVMKVAGLEKLVWEPWEGPSSGDKMAEPLSVKGESQLLKGERDVLGKKVPILQVKIVATLGGGAAREQIEQVALYGKGIGLVELTSTTKIAKRKAVSVLKLTKIEEPKEGS